MATLAVHDREFSVGNVFSRGFGAIGSNPGVFFGASLLFGALPGSAITLIRHAIGFDNPFQAFANKGAVTIGIAFSLLGLFFYLVSAGALVRATVAASEGRQARLGECAAIGARSALPLLLLFILLLVGVWVGTVLFIVPGIILFTMWSVAVPALVEERIGILAAFGRSRYLTKGARWRVFGVNLVLLVLLIVVSSVFWLLLRGAMPALTPADPRNFHLPIGLALAQIVLGTLVNMLWSAIQNALYVELREAKDENTPDHLAAVFA